MHQMPTSHILLRRFDFGILNRRKLGLTLSMISPSSLPKAARSPAAAARRQTRLRSSTTLHFHIRSLERCPRRRCRPDARSVGRPSRRPWSERERGRKDDERTIVHLSLSSVLNFSPDHSAANSRAATSLSVASLASPRSSHTRCGCAA